VRRCECVDCGGGAGSPRSLAVVDFESSAWTHVEGCRAAGQNSWHLCHEVRYADASGDAPETRALLQHASCSSSPRERSNDAYPRQLACALSPDVDIFLFGLCDASRRLRARHQPPSKKVRAVSMCRRVVECLRGRFSVGVFRVSPGGSPGGSRYEVPLDLLIKEPGEGPGVGKT